jgi:hypothetical protein
VTIAQLEKYSESKFVQQLLALLRGKDDDEQASKEMRAEMEDQIEMIRVKMKDVIVMKEDKLKVKQTELDDVKNQLILSVDKLEEEKNIANALKEQVMNELAYTKQLVYERNEAEEKTKIDTAKNKEVNELLLELLHKNKEEGEKMLF